LDPKDPGVIAHLNLRPGGSAEPADRLLLCAWPGNTVLWEVPVRPIKKQNDSAAVLYWEPREVPAGGKREVGFAYGLGDFTATAEGDLGLIVAGPFEKDGPVTVLPLVRAPTPGQKLTLKLSQGLTHVGGDATQAVPAAPPGATRASLVTWRVQPARGGVFAVTVTSSTGSSHQQLVPVNRE